MAPYRHNLSTLCMIVITPARRSVTVTSKCQIYAPILGLNFMRGTRECIRYAAQRPAMNKNYAGRY